TLAKNPAERYGTAQEFADDLRRFLDDRPILARRPTPVERLHRWANRHRALVRTAILAVLFASVCLAVSLAVVSRKRDEAERRAGQAGRARDRLSDVAGRWPGRQPHLEPLQRSYLEQALTFYEELAREDGRDPSVRLAAGKALRRVADIRQRLGEPQPAEEA